MVPAKFLKVQVVAVIDPAQRVFSFPVIARTKGVVGKLPVQDFSGSLADADLCTHAITAEFFRQWSQKFIHI